ncbi:MAG: hypothetical protein IAG10_18870, partial [Planctomycetaceae bacterium]|nr:hypothetical protein [Planctomycetaceae bacterium]
MLRNFWRSLFQQNGRPGSKKRRRSSQPGPTSSHVARSAASRNLCQGIESLESRKLLTVLTVTSLADTIANDGQVTLREAIQAANTDTTVDGVTGSGADTIQFDPSLTASGPATITLAGTELLIKSDLTINGPGADRLTISGNNASRIFNINDADASNTNTVSISGLKLTGGQTTNSMGAGGAIRNLENLTLAQCVISGNRADVSGGAGVYNAGTLDMSQSTIHGNTGTGTASGAGIWSRGTTAATTITQSTISGNTTDGYGGGIYNSYGNLVVTQSSISGNSAVTGAGVISYYGSLQLAQCTISGNSGSGEGVNFLATNSTTIDQCTITGNGIGILQSGSDLVPLTLTNTIVAGNSSDVRWRNAVVQAQNNLIGNPNSASGLVDGVDGNIVGQASGTGRTILNLASVLNQTLADNGGLTKTHTLVSGSPAINAGNNSLIPADTSDRDGDGDTTEPDPFDQRGAGFARVFSDTVDLGAVEFGTPSASVPATPQIIGIGSAASSPSNLINVHGTLFFNANDGSHGRELWKSDGTVAGTSLVKDIQAGSADGVVSGSRMAVAVGNSVFFVANDGVNGAELWKTDGTAAGTVLVADVNAGASGSSPQQLTNVNGTLFFTADNGVNGRELWKSDGTAAGTVMVKDISTASTASSDPTELINVAGAVFFTATDGTQGRELWKSDGTAAGTVLVKDIRAGGLDAAPQFLTNVNGRLFFSATDGSVGRELWKSDGTAAGTVRVKDIRSGNPDSAPQQLANVNGVLYFSATDGTNGRELWKSDGTSSGTVLVKNLNAGSANANPADMTLVGSTIFFSANGGAEGRELWKTDGTDAGTMLVEDIFAGADHANPQSLLNINGRLWFTVIDGTHGRELWSSDGTAEFTELIQDLSPGNGNSDPAELTTLGANGLLLFSADDGVLGRQLWNLDTSRVVAEIPTLSLTTASTSSLEGNSGNTGFAYTITRTDDTSGSASVNFAVTGSGTNAATASDFGGTLPSGTISFAAGEASKTLTINVSGDTS